MARQLFQAKDERIRKAVLNLYNVERTHVKVMEPFRGKGESTLKHIAYLQELEDALRTKLLRICLARLNTLRTGTSGLPSVGVICP